MKNILLIDKPAGWTSFDVVAFIRKQLAANSKQNLVSSDRMSELPIANGKKPRAKVGHAGTLDPFATGLLIILIGKDATRRQDEFMKLDKEYEATLELGKVSTTGDPEGEITTFCHSGIAPQSGQYPESREKIKGNKQLDSCLRRNDIEETIKNFIGEIEQVPPAHSAIKVNGKRAYELARKGIDPKLKPRKVTIYDIKILDYSWPFLKLKIKCGSGTYIRSLAADIGNALKVGAYLTELRRTKIGSFDVKDAEKIQKLIKL